MSTAAPAAVPPMPASVTPAAELDDTSITDEIAALLQWDRRHLLATGEGPHIPRGEPSRIAVCALVGRLRELERVQKQRADDAARAAFQNQEIQRKADNQARAKFGPLIRSSNGSYTYVVSADGLGELGIVSRRGGGRKWRYQRAGTGSSGPEYDTRREAAGDLVWLGDLAAESAARQQQQDAARTAVPEGWTWGDWDDLGEDDIIRTPMYGRAEDGTLYPRAWRPAAEVLAVTRLGNGCVVVSLAGPGGSYADPLFVSSQDMKDVGFLWPAGRTRPEPRPYRRKLRIRMADIADDIATVQRRLGPTPEIRSLVELVGRLERARTPDLFADLRRVEAGTAKLRAQVSDHEQSYEVQRIKSWAVAAHIKAQQALAAFSADPDFASAVPTA
ncbi:hypothetical protein [Streptomyces nitrosporeus]|uniref:hypothetical protein n=1 Tax=Streptomyces TaxID=1883 RepID=UPI0039A39AD4